MSANPRSPNLQQNSPAELPNAVLQQLRSKRDRKVVRANASLPVDSWGVVDETVYETFERELTIVDDLQGAGLTTNISYTAETSEWHVADGEADAVVSMDPETATPEGSVSYDLQGVPVPVVMSDFSTGYRESSVPGEDAGDGVDTFGVSTSARAVAVEMENLVFDGWAETINAGNNSYDLYGLTNHPDRNTGSLSADWTSDNTVVRQDIRRMARALKEEPNNIMPTGGGFWLYLSADLYDVLNDVDPEGTGDMLIRDRVENLSDIGRIRMSQSLSSGTALMFRPTEDVIDLAIGQNEDGERIMGTTVEWSGMGGFRDYYKVLSITAPRVKSTKADQSGIAHYTV